MKEGDERRKIFRWMLFRRPRVCEACSRELPLQAVRGNSPPRSGSGAGGGPAEGEQSRRSWRRRLRGGPALADGQDPSMDTATAGISECVARSF